jgi:hypothetical protein
LSSRSVVTFMSFSLSYLVAFGGVRAWLPATAASSGCQQLGGWS